MRVGSVGKPNVGVGLSLGGGARWDPLAEPALLGVLWPAGASDNGSTLTVPNLKPGGVHATATGGGRPTISATALDGHPGIVTGAATIPLTIAWGAQMATARAITILASGVDSSEASRLLLHHGTGGDDTLQIHAGTGGLDRVAGYRNANIMGTIAAGKYCPLIYPQVLCFRCDGARASGEWRSIFQDGVEIPCAETGAANTSALFENAPTTWGAANGGTFQFAGALGALIVILRELSDAELPRWTQYLHWLNGTLGARRFMYVGDSITSGQGVGHAQWRSDVQVLYGARGDGQRFYWTVGPIGNGSSVPYREDRCFAFSGATTETIVNTYSPSYLAAGGWNPDIIPFLIGTNDLGTGGKTPAQLAVTYRAMLDHFAALYPRAKLIAQKLPPRTDNGTIAAKVVDWNDNVIDGVVTDAVSDGLRVEVDSALADLGGYTYAGDGLHPAAAFGPNMAAVVEPRTRVWAGVV